MYLYHFYLNYIGEFNYSMLTAVQFMSQWSGWYTLWLICEAIYHVGGIFPQKLTYLSVFLYLSHRTHNLLQQVLPQHWIVYWQLLLLWLLTSSAFCSFVRDRFFSFLVRVLARIFLFLCNLLGLFFNFNPDVLFSPLPPFFLPILSVFWILLFPIMPINPEGDFCFLLLIAAISFDVALIFLPLSSADWEHLKFCLLPQLIAFLRVPCLHFLHYCVDFIFAIIFFPLLCLLLFSYSRRSP